MASTLRALIAPALVLATFATTARAEFTYSASGASFGSSLPFGMTFTPVSGTSTTDQPQTITVARITYTPGQAGDDSTTFGFTETFVGTSGIATIAFTGIFAYTSTATAVNAGFMVTGETITGSGYTVKPLLVNYFSNDATTATIQLTVTPAINGVPEPASLAMLGLGLAGALGVASRRRAARG